MVLSPCSETRSTATVWHTTGSGKTLTSLEASTLLKEDDHIHKRAFVGDRKDLDRQTREEFNRFQEVCFEENTNTAPLVRRLLSEYYETAAKKELGKDYPQNGVTQDGLRLTALNGGEAIWSAVAKPFGVRWRNPLECGGD